jgi:hypothetical protein
VFLSVAASVVIWKISAAYRTSMASTEANRKALEKLLKDAQNRIHAADLSGYLALKGSDGPRDPVRSYSRSDEEEAAIESRMNGGGV